MVQIHSVYTGPVRDWNGMVPYRITFVGEPIWYQIADPVCTGSTRSCVNARGLSVSISYRFQTDPVLSKRRLTHIVLILILIFTVTLQKPQTLLRNIFLRARTINSLRKIFFSLLQENWLELRTFLKTRLICFIFSMTILGAFLKIRQIFI